MIIETWINLIQLFVTYWSDPLKLDKLLLFFWERFF